MFENLTFLTDFAVILILAGSMTLLFRFLRQPPILGYIIAGLLAGPYMAPISLIQNQEIIRLTADIGIILIMFHIGMEFNWDRLRRLGLAIFIIAALEITVMLLIGYETGRILGFSAIDSIFLGAALSISSSAIIVKVLQDLGRLRFLSSRIIIGILIVEDFAAITMLAIFSGVATSGGMDFITGIQLFLKLIVFAAATITLGAFVVPPIMKFVWRFNSRDTLLVVSLGMCFSFSIISHFLGLSVAVGAFLMGALIGDCPHAKEVEEVMTPVKDLFAALFFVSMGMLINPGLFSQFLLPALVVSAVFIIGKAMVDSLGTFINGFSGKTPLRVGLAMGQMGEFSLFIIKFGMDAGTISAVIYPVVAVSVAITTLTASYLTVNADPVILRLNRLLPRGIREYLKYTGDWLRTLRLRMNRTDEMAKELQSAVVSIFVNLLIIGTIFLGGTIIFPFISRLAAFLKIREDIIAILFGLIILISCVPSLITTWKGVRALLGQAVGYLVGCRPSAQACRRDGVRNILRDTIGLAILVVIFLLSFPFIARILASGYLALIFLSVVFLIAMVFSWSAVKDIHLRLESVYRRKLMASGNKPGDSTHNSNIDDEDNDW